MRPPLKGTKLSDTSGFQSDVRVSADVTGNRSTPGGPRQRGVIILRIVRGTTLTIGTENFAADVTRKREHNFHIGLSNEGALSAIETASIRHTATFSIPFVRRKHGICTETRATVYARHGITRKRVSPPVQLKYYILPLTLPLLVRFVLRVKRIIYVNIFRSNVTLSYDNISNFRLPAADVVVNSLFSNTFSAGFSKS